MGLTLARYEVDTWCGFRGMFGMVRRVMSNAPASSSFPWLSRPVLQYMI